jgi:hypothetical protein
MKSKLPKLTSGINEAQSNWLLHAKSLGSSSLISSEATLQRTCVQHSQLAQFPYLSLSATFQRDIMVTALCFKPQQAKAHCCMLHRISQPGLMHTIFANSACAGSRGNDCGAALGSAGSARVHLTWYCGAQENQKPTCFVHACQVGSCVATQSNTHGNTSSPTCPVPQAVENVGLVTEDSQQHTIGTTPVLHHSLTVPSAN